MKKKYWMHQMRVLIGIPLTIIFTIIFIVMGALLTKEDNYISILLLIGMAFVLIIIYLIFIDKNNLSKIEFTQEGISITWLKKRLFKVDWFDIIEIKKSAYSLYTIYLTLITKKQIINIDLTKKMYKTIMELCPRLDLKLMINEIEKFKNFRK